MTTVKENWDMCCPKCKWDNRLSITIATAALLTPDGTDTDEGNSGDHEWDENSHCACMACGFEGPAREFIVGTEPETKTEIHEYAFDVRLFAAVRVKAETPEAANRALREVLDALEPTGAWIDGYNSKAEVKLSEVSLAADDGETFDPCEIDGEPT